MPTVELNNEQYDALMTQARRRGMSLEAFVADMLNGANGHGDIFPGIVQMLSHDLRTPLATVMSSSDLIKHYYDRLSEDRLVEHLDTIQTQVRQLDSQLDNLTLLLKVRLGLLHFEPVAHDPQSICQAVIQRLIDHLQPSPEIVFRSKGSASEVVWDQPLLRLALANLLLNALKFSVDARPVYLLLQIEPQQSRIEVRDAGIGVPADEIVQLGQPFFRASNAQSLPGHGLGLTVVRQIVDLHRGDMAIESDLDSGTRVVITLPNGV